VAAGLVIIGALLMFLFNSKGEETTAGDVAPVVPPQGEPLPPQDAAPVIMEDGTIPAQADPLATPPGVLPTVPTPNGGTAPAPAAPIMPVESGMNSSYKDGTYTTVGDYRSPAGPESITVKLTLKDGKIVDSVVTGESNESVSQKFMDGFAKNHKALVVGKSIDEVKLGVVSGSSLTPKGFNAAVEQIKKEAKS
jgi:uncharacterized protein with FMN-binding domain